MSEEPQPLSLSEVKILFSNELSRRENRLRCIDCGHFQPVPEVEETPETPVSDSTDESDDDSEGPKGPTCDSCDSDIRYLGCRLDITGISGHSLVVSRCATF